MDAIWRIEKLMELAVEALALAPQAGQSSGRVRDMPDVRMIRYYTTIGLIDRATEIRGRTAYYGPKHLRQLVAVKRLQGRGLSLVEIQESLAGAGNKKLDQLAALPEGFLEAALANPSETKPEARQDATLSHPVATASDLGDRRRFWSAAPALDLGDAKQPDAPPEHGNLLPRQIATILPLDTGVSLVLEGVAPEQLSPEIVAALQPAVAALRDALVQAGLRQRGRHVDAGPIEPLHKNEGDPK